MELAAARRLLFGLAPIECEAVVTVMALSFKFAFFQTLAMQGHLCSSGNIRMCALDLV